MTTIAIAGDHAGYDYKGILKADLESKEIEVEDFGAYSADPVDYPDFVRAAARAVAEGKHLLGIIVGGSRNEAIVANRLRGIRCAVVWNKRTTRLAKEHGDCNMTFVATARTLKGGDRRLFMARTVRSLGPGGQRLAERELGWNRMTIRKGEHELASGLRCQEAYALRGRRRAEEHLPQLLEDIGDLVDGQSQTDPRFRTHRLYVRLSAARVRELLISRKGYRDEELPTVRTLRHKLNDLGYQLKKVAKVKPEKRSPKPMRSSSA